MKIKEIKVSYGVFSGRLGRYIKKGFNSYQEAVDWIDEYYPRQGGKWVIFKLDRG